MASAAGPELPPEATIRGRLASQDPDVIALYERLVVAREGLRAFARATILDQQVEWYAASAQAAWHVHRAQLLIEGLK